MMVPLNTVKVDADRIAVNRECGPCTACCVLPRIAPTEDKALPGGKLGYTPCDHLCERGCSIYHKRPKLCRDYACLWRVGIIKGDDSRRPDRLGLMFTPDEYKGKLVIETWEMWPHAASDDTARWVIDTIAERYTVAIRPYGVPISNQYCGKESLLLADQLSEWAISDPTALADWIDARLADRSLSMPKDDSAFADLDSLREGNRVKIHYEKKV